MPIDPAGTEPGLRSQSVNEAPKIALRCKNPKCDSIEAIEIKIPNQGGRRMYQCTKCKVTTGVNIGGSIDI